VATWCEVATPLEVSPALESGCVVVAEGATPAGSIHLDWLTVTLPPEARPEVLALLAPHLGEPEPLESSARFYGGGLAWLCGARLDVQPTQASMGGRERLALSGEALRQLPIGDQLRVVKRLAELGAKGTRVDAAFDDFNRLAPMSAVHAACQAGHFAGFQVWEPRGRMRRNGDREGDMVTMGSRGSGGSGKYLRIYDKNLESDGAIDCIRWELELSQERAEQAFTWLATVADVAAWRLLLGNWIGGAVDFIERDRESSDRHLDRCPRLAWWEQLRELLGAAELSVPRAPSTLQERVAWALSSVSRIMCESAAVLVEQGYDAWALLLDAWRRGSWRVRQSVVDAALLAGGLDVESLLGTDRRLAGVGLADLGP
jgi:hypothetical protein